MIKIVNLKTHKKSSYDVYIGRGSVLGNPYTHLKYTPTKAKYLVIDRWTAIDEYRKYINKEIENNNMQIINTLKSIYEMSLKHDVYLCCYCKPQSCHGDVIKEIIERMEYDIVETH